MEESVDFRRACEQLGRLCIIRLDKHVHFVAELSRHADKRRHSQNIADAARRGNERAALPRSYDL